MAHTDSKQWETCHKWLEISRKALRHNAAALKSRLQPATRLCAVIKSNAYGHGMPGVASTIADRCDFFAVHEMAEARQLLQTTDRLPVLLLGPLEERHMEEAVAAGLHVTVYRRQDILGLAQAAAKLGKPADLHLKIDTGTSRQGILPHELPSYLALFAECRYARLTGVSMHFANIEDTFERSYAKQQLQRFHQALAQARSMGFQPALIHSACSAATLLFAETHFNMVRTGISLYGLWPSKETFISFREQNGDVLALEPALAFKSRIIQLKTIAENTPVGYGCTFITPRRTRLAVIPVGYSDGYSRCLGNRANVLVRGKYARVVGRVCMNLSMLDVTDIPGVAEGDVVVLIGKQGDKRIPVEALAALSGTINYEVTTRLNPALPRFFVD